MPRCFMAFASLLAFVVQGAPSASAGNWPAWRGPGGQGVCDETGLPLEWDRERNVRWKLRLPARGNSTPIVWEGRVFLTQATDGGRTRATLCVDRARGTVLWRRDVSFEGEEPTHRTNPYCSASPATDGERVVVWHGSAGLFAYDLEGKLLWERDLGRFEHIWGNASSPVLHGELCILNCGPGERTFLIALDRETGDTRWKVEIPGGRRGQSGRRESWTGSWSTPLVVRERVTGAAVRERQVILVSYPGRLRAFAPGDGAELWSASGLGPLVYTSPVAAEGVVAAMSGFGGPAIAVRAGGTGDVTESRRLWRHERAPQRIGSGVVHDGRLHLVNDRGMAECIDLASGEHLYRERAGVRSWSSAVLAGERIYVIDESGTTHVLRAGPRFERLARNALEETTRASIAPSDGELFIRTYEHLWCIGEGTGADAE